MAEPERVAQLKAKEKSIPSLDLNPKQLGDLESLLSGAYWPLQGFMNHVEYESVRQEMKMPDGTFLPMPVTLAVPETVASRLQPGSEIALRDPEGVMLAVLTVDDVFLPDLAEESRAVFGTADPAHPGVAQLLAQKDVRYVGGKVEGVQMPVHYDFRDLRLTPAEVHREFRRLGWRKVIGYCPRDLMHRAEHQLTTHLAREFEANLLIMPAVGSREPGDRMHYSRVRALRSLTPKYPAYTAMLALCPQPLVGAGPREAMMQALVFRNYGCTHFIVEPHHASPPLDRNGKTFYPEYAAQELCLAHADDLGIRMVPTKTLVYVEEIEAFVPQLQAPKGARTLSLTADEVQDRLRSGRSLPEWFTFPEVAEEMRRAHPPRHKQGFTVFFTGLSGSGKSTLANVLLVRLMEMGGRPVTLLDGDLVRKHLSSELGFSREHRDLNIRRIGFVASEITKNGGIAICAPIAPYDSIRKENRRRIEQVGGYILVYVSTPLEVCEARDRKGLYAKARAGLIKEFTGVSDPYEVPDDADLVIDTTHIRPEEAVQQVINHLEHQGYIGVNG